MTRTLAIAAAAGSLAIGGVAAATTASAETDTVVVDCLGQGVARPRQIVVTCADAGVTVTRIRWSSWSAERAQGTGTLSWNTCLPDTCADGIVQKYPVRVTLGRVASAPNPAAFTRMTLAFPKGGPAAIETGSYTLDRAFG